MQVKQEHQKYYQIICHLCSYLIWSNCSTGSISFLSTKIWYTTQYNDYLWTNCDNCTVYKLSQIVHSPSLVPTSTTGTLEANLLSSGIHWNKVSINKIEIIRERRGKYWGAAKWNSYSTKMSQLWVLKKEYEPIINQTKLIPPLHRKGGKN